MAIMIKIVLVLVGLMLVFTIGYILNNLYYFRRYKYKTKKAGFFEKKFVFDDMVLNYAEGPSNGPALLLIHGQTTNWGNYVKVLSNLSKSFHIYAVDCHGHGNSSKNQEKYNIKSMGKDFVLFLKQVINEPVIISGHSSGGLLTAWLAAYSPENIVGIVLEDPPFFSSELPRYKDTFAYNDTSLTCHNFINQSQENDFIKYYIKNCEWLKFFKDGQQFITNYCLSYRERYPDIPLKIFFLPPTINEQFRAMDLYDPHFGDAFYDGSWHGDLTHEDILSKISCTSILIHTNWSYDENGMLLAAMNDKDANYAHSLMQNNKLIKVKSGHGFHFEKPEEFIKIMMEFKEEIKV